MALSNLKLVSETLKNLLSNYFKVSEAWTPFGSSPEVSLRPPDKLTDEAVGIYLYHITEDTQYKNLPAPGNDAPPVRFTPMGLNLYYLLTAHSTTDSSDGTLKEQQMMTIAMKALHDYPVLDEKTMVNGQVIFASELQGTDNRFRISLMPVEPTEAIGYWTAGSSPLRLSAYYQVSVVLLEPEESKSRAARVLSFGIQSFVGGTPRLEYSQNILYYALPGQTDQRVVDLRPAEVPPFPTKEPDLPKQNHEIILKGNGLEGGDVILTLSSKEWDESKDVDPLWWAVEVNREGIRALVRETTRNGGDVLLPGLYAAQAKVLKTIALPDGSTRRIEHSSNACPFSIAPRIDEISPPDSVTQVISIKGFGFQPAEAVWVYIGPNKLERTTNDTVATGQYKISEANTLELKLPTGLEPGKYYPMRILVNGVESAPKWIYTS